MKLFEPFELGGVVLRNRVVMAPLTRCRAAQGTLALGPLNALYYRQRASAGLIIGEATQICPEGQGYAGSPGLYSDAQVAGWKLVTDAVHEEGGRIFAQLWHVGRISHPALQPGGVLPVAPSAIQPEGVQALTAAGMVAITTPRALELAEIPGVVETYATAARNALRAGFDGVEIHGANGYLIDQFLRDGSNVRKDIYGGSVENRLRFALEVVDAVVAVCGAARVGIRLSPVSPVNAMRDSQPQAVFGALIEQLDRRKLVFVHMIEGSTRQSREVPGFDYAWARAHFRGAYIANNCYTRALALATVESGRADLIAFGRPFIANPDLVERLRRDAPLAVPKPELFYGGGEEGYTDYPALAV